MGGGDGSQRFSPVKLFARSRRVLRVVFLSRPLRAAAWLLAVGVLAAPAARADIIYGGAYYPQPPYNNLYIGYGGAGTMMITAGSTLETTTDAYLAYSASDSAVVTVDGSGSKWTVDGRLLNGASGSSTIKISNGGTVLADDASGNSWDGSSTLAITTGGHFTAVSAVQSLGSSISVDGAGSTFSATSLLLGEAMSGSSTLSITNGASVSLNILGLTEDGNATSSLVVNAAALAFSATSSPGVGYGIHMGGQGSSVQFLDGAQVTSGTDVIDSSSTASTGTALVSGAGTKWTTGFLAIGSSGNGEVTVADGAEIDAGSIGLAATLGGATSGTLEIGDGGAPGIVDTAYVNGGTNGTGTAIVAFDHTATNYYFTSTGASSGTGVVIMGVTQVVANSGTTTLTAASTYTGGTTVNRGGSLFIDNSTGSGTGTGNVVVNAGGTLGGKGTIAPGTGKNVTVSGNLAPGDTSAGGTAGTLHFSLSAGSQLVFTSGSSLTLNLVGGGVSDEVSFANAAASGSEWLSGAGQLTLVLDVSGTNAYGQTYDIFHNAIGSLTTGQFTLAGITGYDTADYQAVFTQSGSDYLLNFEEVPEPSAYALLLLGGGLGLAARRQRLLPVWAA